MISVITPTHNPRWLQETHAALKRQTHKDWEWVLVPNGPALGADLPRGRKVRIVPYEGVPNIGSIKRFAFDHDDLLTPNALGLIADALEGADFAYSNCAEFCDETWEAHSYNPSFGWRGRDLKYKGHQLKEMLSWKPMPASICYVWWAPNHVRAWTRDGYERAGKHDPNLTVGDDHDLVVRTYLSGKMAHINQGLYLQRLHPDSETVKQNAAIQAATRNTYAWNIDAIVRRWGELEGLPLYDLGGAHNPAEGWTPIDVAQGGPDLRGRWPWDDSSVGAFRAFDFLEHLPDKMHTLSEIHRCLVPGGWLLSCTPSALGRGAFQDPSHCSYWVRDSFRYVTESGLADYIENKRVRFQAMRLHEDEPYEIVAGQVRQPQRVPYVTADLVALKEGYNGPGQVLI
jgi:SAM-dependent methyltransferase